MDKIFGSNFLHFYLFHATAPIICGGERPASKHLAIVRPHQKPSPAVSPVAVGNGVHGRLEAVGVVALVTAVTQQQLLLVVATRAELTVLVVHSEATSQRCTQREGWNKGRSAPIHSSIQMVLRRLRWIAILHFGWKSKTKKSLGLRT